MGKVAKEDILPTNYEVLQRELPILDIMTRNRERRVWAIARGESVEPAAPIDDSETPPFVDAKTNLTKTSPFIGPEASLAEMTVGQNLKVEVFASEEKFPELVNPVQMSFDTKGRLWVAVWKSYPQWQPKTPMDDKLLILEDTNGDGRADKRTVFAGDLENPTGFEFWNGGVIVADQPNLMFLKDTNGDDRYDTREILLHGFDSADSHHAINSFVFDPGGALYMQEGIFHRTQIETPWATVLRQADGGVYRFEPRTWKVDTYVPMNFPNPHGHVFDGWGRDIIFDGTGGQPYWGPSFSTRKYYPAMETTKAPRPGPVRTRPVGAAEFITGSHFPESMRGNMIVLNVIGFRGLLNYRMIDEGAGQKSEEVEPILQSADENFRPVDAEIGPDGALYFVDWHNPVIGHMQHNLRDTSRDRLHGRVYRVTAVGRPLVTPARIFGEPIPALLDLLKSPEYRVRYRTKIELSARPTNDVMAALDAWIPKLDQKDPQFEHHMMEALWLRQWHNRVDEPLLAPDAAFERAARACRRHARALLLARPRRRTRSRCSRCRWPTRIQPFASRPCAPPASSRRTRPPRSRSRPCRCHRIGSSTTRSTRRCGLCNHSFDEPPRLHADGRRLARRSRLRADAHPSRSTADRRRVPARATVERRSRAAGTQAGRRAVSAGLHGVPDA